MTAGRGPDGEELEPGDTYHSLETISEDSTPEASAEGELLPGRAVPSRKGLPLTEAIGRLGDKLDKLEKRTRRIEIAGGVLVGVVLGLTGMVFAEAIVIFVLWGTT